ncbi:MAG: ATP-binding protein [Pseudomonadota bacterium]
MIPVLRSSFQSFRKMNSGREQAIVRVIFALMIFTYLILTIDSASPGQQTALLSSGGFLAFSLIWMAAFFYSQKPSENWLLLAMFADLSAITFVMLKAGEVGALLYGIYLWVIVGNGLRYGTQALVRSQIISVVGFLAVILFNDYWAAHRILGFGLLLTLILIPFYIFRLLQRLNRAITQAEEANKAKSYFLANMSHEMRTPLNGVIGASDLIMETPLNAEQKDLVVTLRNSGQMLLKLIENVLDLSKIESGRLESEVVEFDLHSLIRNTVAMFLPQAEKNNLQLQVHFSPETCFQLRGDSLHLRQVIINLVGNAIKFTDKGLVELRISTLSQDDVTTLLKFEVIDTGIGIAHESQQAIFDSFTQANAGITSKYGGTGLGTTISKRLVEFMGGRIGLHSNLGAGSVFWFELPFQKQLQSNYPDVPSGIDRIRVITVGLRGDEQRVISGHLSSWRVSYEHAASLTHFFAHLLHAPLTGRQKLVILANPKTYKVSPAEFTAQLWAGRSANDLPLMLIDPDLYTQSEEELLQMGCSCVLRTPVDKTLLFNALHGVIAGHPIADVISFREHYERNSVGNQSLDILVADDNGTNRKIISKILERGGHRVDTVEDGEQALDTLEKKQYDLAIMDMFMPGLDGPDAIRIYRATVNRTPRMPVIILTANATVEARQVCEEAGVDAFLTKPIDAISLLDTVAQLTAPNKKVRPPNQEPTVVTALKVTELCLNENTLRHLEVLGGGNEFVKAIIEGFIAESEQLLGNMKTILLQRDYQTFKNMAHTLKGSAGNVGAEILARICHDISRLSPTDLQNSADDLISQMNAAFKSVQFKLAQYLDNTASSRSANIKP